MNAVLTLGAIVLITLLLYLLTRRQQNGRAVSLRPLPALATLSDQMGEAIESGRQVHLGLGQASLASSAAPASVAAVHILKHLAQEGCDSGSPPLTTVGESTLLPLAQDSLRYAYQQAGRTQEYKPRMAQFVAANTDSYAYAAGITSVIQQNKTNSNILVGRYGPEIAIATEAAIRQNMNQIIGTDDPTALAVATAVTDNILIGEELFAANAYLEGHPSQIASLQTQDILRAIIMLTILALAVYTLITG